MIKGRSIIFVLLVVALGIGLFAIKSSDSDRARGKLPSQPTEQIDLNLHSENAPRIRAWFTVEDFEKNLAVLETVFWDPRDTISLRELIRAGGLTEGKDVLEIGTGSGLLALCCLKADAKKVVATDVNESAIENANLNARHLGLADRLETRLVQLDDSSAFSVIKSDEKFDLIISNPPWVNRKPESIDEYALYDANFELMKSLFDGLQDHLKPGGRVLLAYGCVDAIKTMEKLAKERKFGFIIRDKRKLDDLPEEFLPGMLVEIQVHVD